MSRPKHDYMVVTENGNGLGRRLRSKREAQKVAKLWRSLGANATILDETGSEVAIETIDLGNNEAVSRGVVEMPDGTYTAMTFTRSKSGFKTRNGAERWYARNTGK